MVLALPNLSGKWFVSPIVCLFKSEMQEHRKGTNILNPRSVLNRREMG